MGDIHKKEEEAFQQELTIWLKKPLSYIKEKGYGLSEEAIARYQKFFDKQAGYREGRNTFEELRAIPKEVMMAARCWAQHETNKQWDAEQIREQAEQDCIDRVTFNLSIIVEALSEQAAKNRPLQKALKELKKDTTQFAKLVQQDHRYMYMVDGLDEDE